MTPSDEKMWTVLIESQEFSCKALTRLMATASPEMKKELKKVAEHLRDAMEILSKAVHL